MSRHTFSMLTLCCAAVACGGLPTWLAAQPLSLRQAQESYPDGSSRPPDEFLSVDQFVFFGAAETSPQAARILIGSAVEEVAQEFELLPFGFGLGPGSATLVMGARPGREAVAPALTGTEKWFATYPLEFRGIPLSKHASLLVVTGADGTIQTVRRRGIPVQMGDLDLSVSAAEAVDFALGAAGDGFALDSAGYEPPRIEIWVDLDLRGELSWSFVLREETERRRVRRYWIAASGSPRILDWESLIYFYHRGWWRMPSQSAVGHFGSVRGMAWEGSPFSGTTARSLTSLSVHRDGGGAQTTDGIGEFEFADGSGPARIRAPLSGPYVTIQNQAGSSLEESGTATPGTSLDLMFQVTAAMDVAQVSAFHYVNLAYDFSRTILASLPGRPHEKLPVEVNHNYDVCNAYWTGKSIEFFQAGSRSGVSCPNSAYVDVALHEYGHGVDDWRGGIHDGGYSEGFGDALALLALRQPCVGRDFFGSGTCLRNAQDVHTWPPGPGEGVHDIGRRYAQFTWQLVDELRADMSEDEAYELATALTLASAAGDPLTIPAAVRLLFIADDDDGDLVNGTPHCRALAAAADSRSIPNPGCP